MSDTPRTDAEYTKGQEGRAAYGYVSLDFARQLERDLCRALAEKHQLRHDLSKAIANHSADFNAAPQANKGISAGSPVASPAVAAPTPRTDAEEYLAIANTNSALLADDDHYVVLADFARKLERELATAYNAGIYAAAKYCAETLAENHPHAAPYFRHAAENIRDCAGLNWKNPAPDASEPMVPTGHYAEIKLGGK